MASLEDIRAERLRKLDRLRAVQVYPYPISTKRDYSLADLSLKFDVLQKKAKPISIAGRIKARRGQGAISFVDINDGTGTFQLVLKRDNPPAGVGPEAMTRFQELTDIGDFISATGTLFTTNKNEPSLLVTEWQMLAKSLRPLPDKWHGLQDVEERFRHRYLDTLMSPEVKDRFILRSKMISAIRTFLNRERFLEVETSILQPLAGGANATPFVTHHQALDLDLYLRVAPELDLKKLIIGGFPAVYEIGRSFRNEGIDVTHNPEFTSVEVYASFSEPKAQMALIEKLLRFLIKTLFDSTQINYDGRLIDFGPKFSVLSYHELLSRHANIDITQASERDISLRAQQLGVKLEPGDSRFKMIDGIYKKVCRAKLIQPTFLIDYPVESAPLAKRKTDDPRLVDRFQLIAGGMEIANGFAELNDPLDQRERFLEQEKNRAVGDSEAQPKDEEFLTALEYGLPPTCGWGIGIDRLAMLLTDTKNIREVILFPTLRPKNDQNPNLDSSL